ncbi:hypothetical protein WMY93_029021 [Mugilogobius chulae]|uniref:NLR family member X1 n=1 Tax=Mugilogobius chulae TaxID=88201 RepID=A0AAW0MQ06_9GOBI
MAGESVGVLGRTGLCGSGGESWPGSPAAEVAARRDCSLRASSSEAMVSLSVYGQHSDGLRNNNEIITKLRSRGRDRDAPLSAPAFRHSMGPMQKRLTQLLGRCRRKPWAHMCVCVTSGARFRVYSTSTAPQTADLDPLEVHKQRLLMWFSHLPQEEKQFGGFFSPETMHVDPLILERKPEERAGLLSSALSPQSLHLSKTVEQLFEPSPSWDSTRGINILLYGAVGTGKSTVVRKLVQDWCRGTTLGQVSSLRDLVGRKYLHLRRHPMLNGEGAKPRTSCFSLTVWRR